MIKLNNILKENAEAELDDAFVDFEKEIKKSDLDAPETEGITLLLAGAALSFGEIQKLLGKFINLISKIPGFKKLSGDELIARGKRNHHRIVGVFDWVLKMAGVKDKNKRHKAAEILHTVAVALLLYEGLGTMASKYSTGSHGYAYLKAALNAVKTNEIGTFLKNAFAAI